MAEDNQQHVENLREMRRLYVEYRRQTVISALDQHKANSDGGGLWGSKMAEIQTAIDAIDHALVDEKRIGPSAMEKRMRQVDV